jgi:hypothetical protein
LTKEILSEVFDDKILNAALYAQSTDKEMAFTARMILSTLTAVREELRRRTA